MTNAEYLRSINDRELAIFLERFDCNTCPAKTYVCKCSDRYIQCTRTILNWLKKEREE